jgi:parallel beta-helix repeat protein
MVLVLVMILAGCGETETPRLPGTQATEAVALPATVTPLPPSATVVPTETPAPEAAPAMDLSEIHLEANGSGDFPTIGEALAIADQGATLFLGAGTYRLEQVLTFGDAVHLVGAGMDQTEIVSTLPEHVLRFEGVGPFTAEGITFRHEGTEPADVVAVVGGEVSFRRCRFSGGVYGEQTGVGSGLYLGGSTHGEVRGCESSDNELHGLLLMERALPVIAANSFVGNGDSGIAYLDRAAGTAGDNHCSKNGNYGIYLDGEARPELVGNLIQGNGACGIAYWDRTAGAARENQISGHARDGIYITEQAQPTLEGNSSRDNGETGIAYQGRSGGIARDNDCSANEIHGIYADDEAQPLLEGNTCNNNGDTGIAYFASAGGSARGNHCAGNAHHGIYVAESAGPLLLENECPLDEGQSQ